MGLNPYANNIKAPRVMQNFACNTLS